MEIKPSSPNLSDKMILSDENENQNDNKSQIFTNRKTVMRFGGNKPFKSFFESFFLSIKSMKPVKISSPAKLLQYDLERDLLRAGILPIEGFGLFKHTVPSLTFHYFLRFMIAWNLLTLIASIFIQEPITLANICNAFTLFGDSRIVATQCFILGLTASYVMLIFSQRMLKNPVLLEWFKVYFVNYDVPKIPAQLKEWKSLRSKVNLTYVIARLGCDGLYLPSIMAMMSSPLFIDNYSNICGSIRALFCTFSVIGNFVMVTLFQLTGELYFTYCLIVKFQLMQICRDFSEFENSRSNHNDEKMKIYLHNFLKIHREVKGANQTFSKTVGSVYSIAFLIILLMLYISIFSNASPMAKLYAFFSFVFDVIFLIGGVCKLGSMVHYQVSSCQWVRFFAEVSDIIFALSE